MKKWMLAVIIIIVVCAAGITGYIIGVRSNASAPPPSISEKIPNDTLINYDTEPKVIKRVEPHYPADMLEPGAEAKVILKILIDTSGNVSDAQIINTIVSIQRTGNSTTKDFSTAAGNEFQESAVSAARQWKFDPAKIQGKPVAVWVTIPFQFRLMTGSEKKK
jgi:protein TonB